jgi:hypothetical protein
MDLSIEVKATCEEPNLTEETCSQMIDMAIQNISKTQDIF